MSSNIHIHRSPCVSCPYRRDVPSGIWDESEYEKIVPFDRDTFAQPPATFLCHQANGSLCRGWLDCHGDQLLGLRLSMAKGEVDPDAVARALDEGPAVPVFDSAAEAAQHGRRDIDEPSDDACRLVAKISHKRGF